MKKFLIMFVVAFALFLALPLFVSQDALPSKPAFLPQIYTSNPLTPFMQRFRAFAKNLVNPFENKENIAQKNKKNGSTQKSPKKSLLARAASRIKDAWKKSADTGKNKKDVAQNEYFAENDPLENTAGFENALASLGEVHGDMLTEQRMPAVAVKGMHDIKTKEAYEEYMRSSGYKPQDNEVFLPQSGKRAIGNTLTPVAKKAEKGGFLSRIFGKGNQSGNKNGNSLQRRSGSNSGTKYRTGAERAQAWQDIHHTIDEIATMRANMKYPNPKTDKERAERNALIEKEKGNITRQINQAYVAELTNLIRDAQNSSGNTEEPEDDIAALIHFDLKRITDPETEEEKWRSINNKEDPSKQTPNKDGQSIVVIGGKVNPEELFVYSENSGIENETFKALSWLYQKKCPDQADCSYIAQQSDSFKNQDLAIALNNAGFTLSNVDSEEEREDLIELYKEEVIRPGEQETRAKLIKEEEDELEKKGREKEEYIANHIERITQEKTKEIKEDIERFGFFYGKDVSLNKNSTEKKIQESARKIAKKELEESMNDFVGRIYDRLEDLNKPLNEEYLREKSKFWLTGFPKFTFQPAQSDWMQKTIEDGKAVFCADKNMCLSEIQRLGDNNKQNLAEKIYLNVRYDNFTGMESREEFTNSVIESAGIGIAVGQKVVSDENKKTLEEYTKNKFASEK